VAKVLNVESLAKPAERVLSLGGTEYTVLPMTVDNFIETTKAVEDMQARDAPAREQVEETVRMISRFVPKLPVELLKPLSLDQLGIIMSFVQGDYDPDAPAAAGGSAEAKK
jgi:hypothetical protein